MCGIAGYIRNSPISAYASPLREMLESIRQRGPDDEGICLVSRNKHSFRQLATERTVAPVAHQLDRLEAVNDWHDVAIIHTRYSIIDLSPGGHQPFVSQDGSVVAAFNGEIYNYVELREELTSVGLTLRTNSDTEVLVEGYRLWGDALWPKLNGFWAVALYDSRSGSLVLSRDRLGVAPLYFREVNGSLYFASSIRTLASADGELADVDEGVLMGFIETSLKDFDSSTCYRQIRSLPAASVVRFSNTTSSYDNAEKRTFWQIPTQRWSPKDISFGDAVERCRDTLFSAVELRLRADVKVAFELSGGLDSSSIAAVAATQRQNDITTYTIEVPEANEVPFAKALLEKYPVDFQVLGKPDASFIDEIVAFTNVMDEPYHSPNIFTHYQMRQRMKAQGVAAVVSGSGGDEVFAGYETAFWPQAAEQLRNDTKHVHAWMYDLVKNSRFAGRTLRHAVELIGSGARVWLNRFKKLGQHPIRSTRQWCSNRANQTAAKTQTRLTTGSNLNGSRACFYERQYPKLPYDSQRLYHFEVGLLPYYLRSNDQFTMAIPLEHRFPMLDYRMVEIGMQMPIPYLFKNGWTKYLLRKAMEPFLPKRILWRKEKFGFPFSRRPFLSANRSRLEPFMSGVSAFLHEYPKQGYDELLHEDPSKLWRICSVGLWLSKIGQSALPVSV